MRLSGCKTSELVDMLRHDRPGPLETVSRHRCKPSRQNTLDFTPRNTPNGEEGTSDLASIPLALSEFSGSRRGKFMQIELIRFISRWANASAPAGFIATNNHHQVLVNLKHRNRNRNRVLTTMRDV